jgi:PAS domain S-box-containing protein
MTDSPATTSTDSDLYRRLIDSVSDYAIIAVDASGLVVTWNPGAQRFSQYAPDEAIGRPFSSLFAPDHSAATSPDVLLATALGAGHADQEMWLVRKDGSSFCAHVSLTTLRDEAGAFVGLTAIIRDLGESRTADGALENSEQRFRLIVQSIKDYGIFMLDPLGHIVSWNPGAERLKGYTADDIIGKHFSIFYPQEDLDSRKPWRELEVAGKVGRFEDEGWRLRKDGSRFWANVVITALHNEAGELVGFAKVTRDLTERRAAQIQALADMRRVTEADMANRAKSEFLMAMSHELRTPLNAIGGYAELLSLGLGGGVTDRQREYLNRIRKSQQHLMALINDILNFGRIEGGQITYEVAEISMSAAIDSVVPMIEPQADAKQLSITRPTSDDVIACADRGKVEQILINLLSNSVKYTDVGGRIDISYATVDGRAQIRVTDTGIGIPADKLGAIFEPFVQVGRSLARPAEGTGLGLAISRDLARAMGGDLTAESTIGKGAIFTLTLPGT